MMCILKYILYCKTFLVRQRSGCPNCLASKRKMSAWPQIGFIFHLSFILAERINQTVEIIKHTVDIEEKGVKLKLTIVDTPGFGDAVNNNEW